MPLSPKDTKLQNENFASWSASFSFSVPPKNTTVVLKTHLSACPHRQKRISNPPTPAKAGFGGQVLNIELFTPLDCRRWSE
ncbi:MAG: hypothetical protein Q8K98_09990 [Bacteroidota bacterium]|nr:hypothetical protein [Bacteroidota bacterium]